MARQSIQVDRTVQTVFIGADTNNIRVFVVRANTTSYNGLNGGLIAITAGSGTDPDTNYTSADPDTRFLNINGDSSIFEHDAPSGAPWEVRLTLAGGCMVGTIVEIEEI